MEYALCLAMFSLAGVAVAACCQAALDGPSSCDVTGCRPPLRSHVAGVASLPAKPRPVAKQAVDTGFEPRI
jgi:hypothetical protein